MIYIYIDYNLYCCFDTCLSVMFFSLQFIPFRTENFHEAGLRLIFDISFFVIITTISLSITFSIILDAFSTTQQERVIIICIYIYTCKLIVQLIILYRSHTFMKPLVKLHVAIYIISNTLSYWR